LDAAQWTPLSEGTGINLRGLARGNGRYVAVGNEGRVFTSSNGEQWNLQPPLRSGNLRGIAYGNGLFVAAAEAYVFVSPDGIAWTQWSNLATSLYGITFADGLFVAVGEGGAIVTSPNGMAWTRQITTTPHRLHGITRGGGLFVAAGSWGTIMTSPNGITPWTTRDSGTNTYFESVAYGNASTWRWEARARR
jgi:hypothetical protein